MVAGKIMCSVLLLTLLILPITSADESMSTGVRTVVAHRQSILLDVGGDFSGLVGEKSFFDMSAQIQQGGQKRGGGFFGKVRLNSRQVIMLMILLASVILFYKKQYRFRYLTLLISVLYLGFYVEEGMCFTGAIANFLTKNSIQHQWLVMVAAPILSTILFGRIFCGWFCMFGGLQEFLYIGGSKVLPRKKRINLPSWSHYFKFVVLIFILAYAAKFSKNVFCSNDPFNYIFGLTFHWDIIGVFAILLITSSLLIERPFCKLICPLGGLLLVSEKFSIFRVRVNVEKCDQCLLCNRVCPMGKDIPKDAGECINCSACLEKCNKDAIYYGRRDKK